MHALEESAHAHQAERSDEGEQRAGEHQQGGDGGHSITSPRSRNFAAAAVDTKPSMPITSAVSKKARLPAEMPKLRISSMAFTYSVSRARTRSCARGPRSSRYRAQAMA